MHFFKKTFARVILFLAFFLVPSLLQSPAANAYGEYPGAGAMSPFYGLPMYPGQGSSGGQDQTGQWADYVAQVQQSQMLMQAAYIANQYDWPGSQPMGYSYLPPMGLSAISNSLSFSSSARY